MEKYIIPFLFSFLAAVVAIGFLLRVKNKVVRRLGGGVVILVFTFFVLLNKNLVITRPIAGILAGGLIILVFGFWDDLKNLNWKWQLLFQIIIAVVAISFGVRSEFISSPFGGVINLTNPVIFFILYSLFFILFLNSLNWLDGSDGLAGSVTLVALAAIFFLSLLPHVNQPAVAIICSITGGAVLGFLIFNWHPARILAGTAGAWFFGFLLASLSIFAGAKIATVLMVALIPVLDFWRVIWERYRAGQSVFVGNDGRHLHHKLLKLGMKEGQVAALAAAASVFIGLVALNISAIGKIIFIICFSLGYFILCNLKLKTQKSKRKTTA